MTLEELGEKVVDTLILVLLVLGGRSSFLLSLIDCLSPFFIDIFAVGLGSCVGFRLGFMVSIVFI